MLHRLAYPSQADAGTRAGWRLTVMVREQVREVARALLLSEAPLDTAALLLQAPARLAASAALLSEARHSREAGAVAPLQQQQPPSHPHPQHAARQQQDSSSWAAALAVSEAGADMPAGAPAAADPPTIVAGAGVQVTAQTPPGSPRRGAGSDVGRGGRSPAAGDICNNISGYFRGLEA